MTADVRGRIICPLGSVISGSFAESTSIQSGVITVTGDMVLEGPVSVAEGYEFRLALYDPSRATVRPIGPLFYVISTVYNPGDKTTTVSYGDRLAFYAEYEVLPTRIVSVYDSSTATLDDNELNEFQKNMLIKPLSADRLAQVAGSLLGMTVPTGLGMTFYRETVEIDGNVMAVLNDLYVSACKCLYSDAKGAIQAFNIGNVASWVSVPWSDVISVTPNGTPLRAASNVLARWNSKVINLDGAEDGQNGLEDDPNQAGCVTNNSYEYAQDVIYNYKEVVSDVEQEKEHIEKEYPWYVEKICTDREGREISRELKEYGMYGETRTYSETTYVDTDIFNLKFYLNVPQHIQSDVRFIRSYYSQYVNNQLAAAKESAALLGETALYDANPYYYTFGRNPVLDQFKATYTFKKTWVYEPVEYFWEGIGLPEEAYDNKPLIPPTYRTAWALYGQYFKSYTENLTEDCLAYSYTDDKSWGSRVQSQKGKRNIDNYLRVLRTVNGEQFNWSDLTLNWSTSKDNIREMGQKHAFLDQSVSISQNQVTIDDLKQAIEEPQAPFTSNLEDESVSAVISGGSQTGLTFVYEPPYTDDDTIEIVKEGVFGPIYGVVKSNAENQAKTFAHTQNELRRGKSLGLSVVLPVKYYQNRPHLGASINLDGSAGAYIMDSIAVTFDSDGVVMTADLIAVGSLL